MNSQDSPQLRLLREGNIALILYFIACHGNYISKVFPQDLSNLLFKIGTQHCHSATCNSLGLRVATHYQWRSTILFLWCVWMWVFGEWRYSFIVYVVMQIWSHLWHIGNNFFWFEFKCHIGYICYYEKSTKIV